MGLALALIATLGVACTFMSDFSFRDLLMMIAIIGLSIDGGRTRDLLNERTPS